MKSKNKSALNAAKRQDSGRKNEDQSREARRRLWLRVGAILLTIMFLASECSSIFLLE